MVYLRAHRCNSLPNNVTSASTPNPGIEEPQQGTRYNSSTDLLASPWHILLTCDTSHTYHHPTQVLSASAMGALDTFLKGLEEQLPTPSFPPMERTSIVYQSNHINTDDGLPLSAPLRPPTTSPDEQSNRAYASLVNTIRTFVN